MTRIGWYYYTKTCNFNLLSDCEDCKVILYVEGDSGPICYLKTIPEITYLAVRLTMGSFTNFSSSFDSFHALKLYCTSILFFFQYNIKKECRFIFIYIFRTFRQWHRQLMFDDEAANNAIGITLDKFYHGLLLHTYKFNLSKAYHSRSSVTEDRFPAPNPPT